MKNLSRFQITNDDQVLLYELWRWKFLTTAMAKVVSYPGRTMESCYRRLAKLEKNKFIESRCSANRASNIWQLTEKGYKMIRFDTNHLEHGGFRSENPDHDFWVICIQLSWKLAVGASFSQMITEQQLRKMNFSGLEQWVPGSRQHRPDGWIKTNLDKPNDIALVALEVELSKQSPLRYNDIGNFYSSVVITGAVVWFVRTMADANYFYRHLKNGKDNFWNGHCFIIISDFVKNHFHSTIVLGKNQGQKVSSVLNVPNYNTIPILEDSRIQDTRKFPVNSIRQAPMSDIDLGLIRCS